MTDHRRQWPVEKMARVLAVSSSGYYAWRKRKSSSVTEKNRVLVDQIRVIQKRHRRRYGSPRVWRELKQQGMWSGTTVSLDSCGSMTLRVNHTSNFRERQIHVLRFDSSIQDFANQYFAPVVGFALRKSENGERIYSSRCPKCDFWGDFG